MSIEEPSKNEQPDLTITIAGTRNKNKSIIAVIIKNALEQFHFNNVKINDINQIDYNDKTLDEIQNHPFASEPHNQTVMIDMLDLPFCGIVSTNPCTDGKLNREDRIFLAQTYFGWYTFGLAITESERIDEDCAMDNAGVPYYTHQLNDKQKEALEKRKSQNYVPLKEYVPPKTQLHYYAENETHFLFDSEQLISILDDHSYTPEVFKDLKEIVDRAVEKTNTTQKPLTNEKLWFWFMSPTEENVLLVWKYTDKINPELKDLKVDGGIILFFKESKIGTYIRSFCESSDIMVDNFNQTRK